MLVLLSPTKTMNNISHIEDNLSLPVFLNKTEKIVKSLKRFSVDNFKLSMKVNDKTAIENVNRMEKFMFDKNGIMAIKAYNGISFKRFDYKSFSDEDLQFSNKTIRIISAMYGVLKPFDSIYPYRLEMQSKIEVDNKKSIYDFWSDSIALEIEKQNDIILNLCSNEYSKSFLPYIKNINKLYTCEFLVKKNGILKTQSTIAKQARGLMARYIVENKITKIEEIKNFRYNNFLYSKEKSIGNNFVFIKSN